MLEQYATAHVYGAPPVAAPSIAATPDGAQIPEPAPAECTRLPEEWVELLPMFFRFKQLDFYAWLSGTDVLKPDRDEALASLRGRIASPLAF